MFKHRKKKNNPRPSPDQKSLLFIPSRSLKNPATAKNSLFENGRNLKNNKPFRYKKREKFSFLLILGRAAPPQKTPPKPLRRRQGVSSLRFFPKQKNAPSARGERK